MADYLIDNSTWNEQIRKLQNNDKASAEEVFNPLFSKTLNNVFYLKRVQDELIVEVNKSEYKIGDILMTTRTDLDDNWHLCNGDRCLKANSVFDVLPHKSTQSIIQLKKSDMQQRYSALWVNNGEINVVRRPYRGGGKLTKFTGEGVLISDTSVSYKSWMSKYVNVYDLGDRLLARIGSGYGTDEGYAISNLKSEFVNSVPNFTFNTNSSTRITANWAFVRTRNAVYSIGKHSISSSLNYCTNLDQILNKNNWVLRMDVAGPHYNHNIMDIKRSPFNENHLLILCQQTNVYKLRKLTSPTADAVDWITLNLEDGEVAKSIHVSDNQQQVIVPIFKGSYFIGYFYLNENKSEFKRINWSYKIECRYVEFQLLKGLNKWGLFTYRANHAYFYLIDEIGKDNYSFGDISSYVTNSYNDIYELYSDNDIEMCGIMGRRYIDPNNASSYDNFWALYTLYKKYPLITHDQYYSYIKTKED